MHRLPRVFTPGLLTLALATPAWAIEDCFSEHCGDSVAVIGYGLGDAPMPDGVGQTVFFALGSSMDFNATPGPEMLIGAAKVQIKSGASPGTQYDQIKVRGQVHDTDSLAKLATYNFALRSADYTPNLGGRSPNNVSEPGGGIVTGPGGPLVAIVGQISTFDLDSPKGVTKIQVYTKAGKSLWKKQFPIKRKAWHMPLTFGLGGGVLIGDFLGGDGVDEVRTLYRKTVKGTQTLEYTYYNVRTGKRIRRDTVSVKPPK